MTKRLLPLCTLALAACAAETRVLVVHPAPIYTEPQVVTVGEPVPAPRVEDVPPAPSARHVWCRGYWHWTGTWEWVPGEWLIVKGGYRWVGPRYEASGPRVRYWRAHFRATGRGEIEERPGPGRSRPTPPERAGSESMPPRQPGAGPGEPSGQPGSQPGGLGDRETGAGRPDEGEDRGKGKGKPDEGEDRGRGKGKPDDGEDRGRGKGKPDDGEDRGKGKGKPDEGEDRGKGKGKPDEGEAAGAGGAGEKDKTQKPKQTGHEKARGKGHEESKGKGHTENPDAGAGPEQPENPPGKAKKK